MKTIKLSIITLVSIISLYGCGAKQKDSKNGQSLSASIVNIDSTQKSRITKQDSTQELLTKKLDISSHTPKEEKKKENVKDKNKTSDKNNKTETNKKEQPIKEETNKEEKLIASKESTKKAIVSKEKSPKAAVKPGKLEFHPSNKTKLPKSVKIIGKAINTMKWADRNGENLLILTETGNYDSDTQGKDSELHIYLYRGSNEQDSTLTQVWHIYDYVNHCEFEPLASHIKGSLSITDLDNDKQAEITFMYKVGCKGSSNASPQNKLFMQEGTQRHQFQAATNAVVEAGEDEVLFDSWTDVSKNLREFAEAKWRKYAQ